VSSDFESRLRISTPDGWPVQDQLTVHEPHGRANVIVSTEPLDDGMDARRYADAQGHQLEEFRDYHELTFEPALVFGGRPGYRRWFEWTPEAGERVTQVQIYYAFAGRGYTATATATAEAFGELESALLHLLDAVSLSSSG